MSDPTFMFDGAMYRITSWGEVECVPAVPAGAPLRRVLAHLRLRLPVSFEQLVRYVSGFPEGVDLDTLSRRFFDGTVGMPNGLDAHEIAELAVAYGLLELRGRVLLVPAP